MALDPKPSLRARTRTTGTLAGLTRLVATCRAPATRQGPATWRAFIRITVPMGVRRSVLNADNERCFSHGCQFVTATGGARLWIARFARAGVERPCAGAEGSENRSGTRHALGQRWPPIRRSVRLPGAGEFSTRREAGRQ